MNDRNLLGAWVCRFLLEYLVAERNLSHNTQISYRDTLTLLLPFVSRRASVAIDHLSCSTYRPPSCVHSLNTSNTSAVVASSRATSGSARFIH